MRIDRTEQKASLNYQCKSLLIRRTQTSPDSSSPYQRLYHPVVPLYACWSGVLENLLTGMAIFKDLRQACMTKTELLHKETLAEKKRLARMDREGQFFDVIKHYSKSPDNRPDYPAALTIGAELRFSAIARATSSCIQRLPSRVQKHMKLGC